MLHSNSNSNSSSLRLFQPWVSVVFGAAAIITHTTAAAAVTLFIEEGISIILISSINDKATQASTRPGEVWRKPVRITGPPFALRA